MLKKAIPSSLFEVFEFDPYLCDHSYIKDLRRICHKIKGTKYVNLVIRRVDTPDELGLLGPFMARFTRIESIRGEFPNTQNVGEDGLAEFYRGISNCSFIKTLEWIHIKMPEPSQRLIQVTTIYISRLRLLENLRSYTMLKKGALRDETSEPPSKKTLRPSRIKSIEVAASSAGQWEDMGKEEDHTEDALKKVAGNSQHIQKMKIKSITILIDYESLLLFFKVISYCPNFQYLEWELLK